MFERFTEQARQAVVTASEEARQLKHSYIGSEHLLLGILAEGESLGWFVLNQLGVHVEWAREWVGRIVGLGDEVPVGQIPFTPRSKQAMELALREALSLGHSYIGTEHLLLGLSRQNDSVAARMLDERGVTGDAIRDAVVRALSNRWPIVEPEPKPERKVEIRFVAAPPPRQARRRCEQAFTLHGAMFLCQSDSGHPPADGHVEHGDGWTMRWTPE